MDNKSAKIGIFGGSFDPIHIGHIKTATKLIELRKLDKLFFIPCNISPHKTENQPTNSEHRLQMVKLAIKNQPFFDYSDYEIKKGDISYTYDTILHFSKIYNNIELIIGFDNLVNFDKWKEPDKIVELAQLLVMHRTFNSDVVKNKYFEKAVFVDTPIVDISSTEIRSRLKTNKSIADLVPAEVEAYIIKNELYK